VEILLVAELDSTELTERVEAQKIATKILAEGNAQNIKIQKTKFRHKNKRGIDFLKKKILS